MSKRLFRHAVCCLLLMISVCAQAQSAWTTQYSLSLPVVSGIALAGPVQFADVNNDGLIDVIAIGNESPDTTFNASSFTPMLYVWLQQSDHSYGPAITSSLAGASTSGDVSAYGGLPSFQFAVGDLDGDGLPELVFAGAVGCVNSQQFINIFHNNGGGTFSFSSSSSLNTLSGACVSSVTIGDVTGDGRNDIVVSSDCQFSGGSLTCGSPQPMVVTTYVGEGTLSAPISSWSKTTNNMAFQSFTQVGIFKLMDIDGDGNLDAFLWYSSNKTVGQDGGTAGVAFGDGTGGFPVITTTSNPASRLLPDSYLGQNNFDLISSSLSLSRSNWIQTASAESLGRTIGPNVSIPLGNAGISASAQGNPSIGGPVTVAGQPHGFIVINPSSGLYAVPNNGTGTFGTPYVIIPSLAGSVEDEQQGAPNWESYILSTDNTSRATSPFSGFTRFMVYEGNALSKGTTTVVQSSDLSIFFHATVTFTATVSATSGAPSGSVTFFADGNSIGIAPLSNGTASITNNTLSIGSHQITASYTGSGSFSASTSPAITQTITQVPTGLNANISPSPGIVTQNINISVGVSAADGSTPTGAVSIVADGSSNLGSPTLSGGVATVNTSSLSLGFHSIAVSYPGNTTYESSSTTKSEQVVKIPTTTALSLSSNNVPYGTNVTFTATVTSSFGTPAGSVTFVAGSTQIGTVTLNAGGVATVATNTLTAGSYPVTASYSGATNFATSIGGPNNLTVVHASVDLTWTPPAPIVYGTPLSNLQLDATATSLGVPVPGIYAYSPASGAVLSAGSHTLNVVFTPTDTTDYSGASSTVQITVNKANPVITWATPTPITYGTALSGMQLNASANVLGTLAYSPAGGSVLGAGSQTLNVDFTPTDTADYNMASDSVQLLVNKATPLITWPTPSAITYGTPLSATQLDATVSFGGSSVPGTLVYLPIAGTVLAAGTQNLNVAFTPTDTADYNSASQTTQIQVNKANPVLTWNAPAPITFGEALSSLQLNAVATGVGGVSLPGQLLYTPASGDVLTAGTQTLSVSFTPTDTLDYNTASATVQLLVNKATVRIKWLTPAPINFGTPLSGTQLDASAGLIQGTFMYSPASGAVLTAGMHNLSATFTPTDTLDYNAASATVQLQVNKLTPTITWVNPAPITYGTTLTGTQLDASSNVPGTFVYSPISGSILNAGLQELTVTLTPTDAADYTTGTANVPLTVNKATPTLSLVSSSNPSIYKSAVTFTATISNGLTGTVTFFDGSSAIGTAVLSGNFASVATSSLMVGTHSITARWDGNANFNPVISAPVQQAVKDLVPTITWNNPSPIVYGRPLSGVQLDATASTTGTFVYSPALGAILTAGSHQLNVTFTPTDTADYAVQTASVNIVVEKATPVINWPTPAAIAAGTPLSSTQLNATASVPGTFVYNPDAGTVLPVGTQQLNVTFTPSDTANYTTTNSSVPINVVNFTISVGLPATAPSSGAISATAMAASTPKAENVTVAFGSGDPFNTPLTLTPLSGFTGEVQLSCKGVPETMGCDFAQPTVNITSGAVTTSLSITTQGRSVTYSAALYLGIIALGLGFRRRVRKSLAIYCVAVILCLAAFFNGMIGCGGMNYTQFDGTPKGTYTITVVAASNSLINTAKVTVTVQ